MIFNIKNSILIYIGDVVIPNVLGLGVDVVACKKVAE